MGEACSLECPREVIPSPTSANRSSRRSIVCLNVEQARKDRADRDAIVASLREQLKKGDETLVGHGARMVEDMHRAGNSVLETRPIYHKRDETIRGHVFCSFLALLRRTELLRRIEDRGERVERARMISDLSKLRNDLLRLLQLPAWHLLVSITRNPRSRNGLV